MKGLLILALLYALSSHADQTAIAVRNSDDILPKNFWKEYYIHPEAWFTPFNKITQVACHNCYEPELVQSFYGAAIPFKDVLSYIKAVEIDIWDNYYPFPYSGSMERNWYVRHGVPQDFTLSGAVGNHSNCSGEGSLADCLEDIKEWSDEHEFHFPISLFLDKKQAWSTTDEYRTPKDLFDLLDSKLGKKLYKPHEQIELNTAHDISPSQWLWPTASELAGKIIVIVNGGSFILDGATRNLPAENITYNREMEKLIVSEDPASAFAGPYAFTTKDFSTLPLNTSKNAIFLNSDYTSGMKEAARQIFSRDDSRMIRLWKADHRTFCDLRLFRVSYLAYYDFRKEMCKGFRILPMKQTEDGI